jgi:hypothetical protein
MKKRDRLAKGIAAAIQSNEFKEQHRRKSSDFTRMSPLNFPTLFLILLRKSVKSIQNVLNELFLSNQLGTTVTSSAYTQARKKLKHTAFIALNTEAIEHYYAEGDFKRWKGYRVFGVDASKIILPNEREIHQEFGTIKIKNQTMEGSYSCALFECRYDVLNKIAVQSSLHPGATYEVTAAIELLRKSSPATSEDLELDIYDRGYATYEFLAYLSAYKRDYVIRCPRNSFKTANELFQDATHNNWSRIVTVKAPKEVQNKIRAQGLPTEIKVRFVSVMLHTGDVEVLATSLINESGTREEFKRLYFLRWGVEGFFNCIKGRLGLENFTGKSVESVKQDFWSTVFISNVETIFTEDIEIELNQQRTPAQLPQKINKSVSFNTIKNMAFELFYSKKDLSLINEQLTLLFKTNTLVQRPHRHAARHIISPRASLDFQKRKRKHVF